MMSSLIRNPSLKRTEKEISKESKTEAGAVKQTLKDLSQLEKEVRKARKATGSADSTIDKLEHYEHKTAKIMNDAVREHDLAVVKLRAAERDRKLKQDRQAKLMRELEAKKSIAEKAIQAQAGHDQAREEKLAEMHGISISRKEPSPSSRQVGLPGQSGPAVQNNGHAIGYGLDYNHTNIDSEGNPQDSQFQRGRRNEG